MRLKRRVAESALMDGFSIVVEGASALLKK